jgi:ubiquinone/menaquinone biosynthesis C-methylase UbiE
VIGTELLDDPQADPLLVGRELRDIARLNALFGGTRAVVRELEPFFERAKRETGNGKRRTWTLLDVGTGSGDIALAARAAARRHGIELKAIGLDLNLTAATIASAAGVSTFVADGNALPVAPRSVDVIVASQVLHHLPRPVAVRWIAAFDRVARRAVVLADLRRSRLAMVGVWAASIGLAMNGITRRDAVLSLRRGYTKGEFEEMLREVGVRAAARYRRGARIVAAWSPSTAS